MKNIKYYIKTILQKKLKGKHLHISNVSELLEDLLRGIKKKNNDNIYNFYYHQLCKQIYQVEMAILKIV